MLNQSILVGRIVKEPEIRETENGNKVTNITLAVQRSFKNIAEKDILTNEIIVVKLETTTDPLNISENGIRNLPREISQPFARKAP